MPNSGKSTLVSVITAARPKIANYPFTTLNPCLGVVKYNEDKTFVVADIPGLIEGAHQGSGLGTTFLRHIERTSVLIHLIDGSNINPINNPVKAFKIINNELKSYNPALTDKPQVIAINKMDLPESQENYPRVKKHFGDLHLKVYPISAVTGEGIKSLVDQVVRELA